MARIANRLNDLWTTITTDPVFLKGLAEAVLILVISAGALFVLRCVLKSIEKRLQSVPFFKSNTRIFGLIRVAAFYVVFIICGTLIINLFNIPTIGDFFYAILILLMAVPVKRFVDILIDYLEKGIAAQTETHVDNIIFALFGKLSGVIIYTVAGILALDMLGINVMPFVAGAGVAGLAIGFAAKDTLSNLIAGILLIIDRPFEVGDRIEVWAAPSGSATWGDVIDIGLRATRIRTTDHIVVIVPNNEIMKRDIVNYTAISSEIRVRINIGVAYDADVTRAKNLIVDVARRIPWVLNRPAPKVVVRNFGESAVDLQLRVWIKNARKRMDTISEITDRVKTVFDHENIEIPYPKRDIIIRHKKPIT
jgi:small-conductance mechanosensitive channel